MSQSSVPGRLNDLRVYMDPHAREDSKELSRCDHLLVSEIPHDNDLESRMPTGRG